jgi:hypothetical protein
VTVKPIISDCTGKIYFTDLQLQEGDRLTGYTPNTEIFLKNGIKHWHNGIVRSEETVIVFNTGETTAGLDCYIYPLQNMEAGTIEISQNGAQKAVIREDVYKGQSVQLLASTRECNCDKIGFYQTTAAGDSKHKIKLEQGKSARILFEYTEVLKGENHS